MSNIIWFSSHLHPVQAADLLTLLCLLSAELCVPTLGDVQGGQVNAGQQGQVWYADEVGELEQMTIAENYKNKTFKLREGLKK